MKWATILSIAFCGIDFAGIARIFTLEKGRDEPSEVWYLFAVWFIVAAFNSSLTWWGTLVKLIKENILDGSAQKILPIFFAGLFLLIRVFLINFISVVADHIKAQRKLDDAS